MVARINDWSIVELPKDSYSLLQRACFAMQSSYFVPFGVDVFRFLEGDAYMKKRWMTSLKEKGVSINPEW